MSPPLAPEFLALQRSLVGRFSLVRELGRGGMGVVFLARDVSLDRNVAIKLLPPALAAVPGYRARFLREARLAAGLSHPNIVPIHLVDEVDDQVFFVMGYVEGESLGSRIRRGGPMTVAEVQRVIQQVAWALGHAHARGVMHRDVKPDNILLERDSGRALVTDFGIAGSIDARTPADGVTAGTPLYLSPEQARGERGDARSDLYALGVTAWYALTARHPH
jgi:serine/threonine protein kinase